MNLYFDLRLRHFVETPGLDTYLTDLTFKAGDGEQIVLQFGRSPSSNGPASVVQAPVWTAESLSATGSLKIGIKAAGDYSDGDLLAGTATFTHDGTLHTYTCDLDLNTTAINTLLSRVDADDTNDTASITDALFELTFKTASGEADRSSIGDITTTIKHDVLSGTEGTPTNAGDPSAYALITATTQYLPSLTGMTGGTATDLDSIATVSTAVGGLYKLVDAATGYARTYELVAGTDAESAPSVIRPDDYAATTNEKVYKLTDATASGMSSLVEDVTPQAGGTFDMNSKQFRQSIGAAIASSTALTVGTDGNYFHVTGTTAITSVDGLAVGVVYYLEFDDVLTLTHHVTDLILPGAANITTAAGDVATVIEYASGDVKVISYHPADGRAVDDTIADGSITKAKIENVANKKVLLRKTTGTGAVEEGSLSELLDFIGTVAQGDIFYRGPSSWQRLAKGADGTFLTLASSIPAWSSAPGGLTLTSQKTSNHTALAGEDVSCYPVSGSITVTLEPAPANGSEIRVHLQAEVAGNHVWILSSADINGDKNGSPGNLMLMLEGDAVSFRFVTGHGWIVTSKQLAPHSAHLYLDTTVTTNSAATITTVDLDAESFDIGGIADHVTDNRIEIRRSGIYDVSFSGKTNATLATGKYWQPILYLNGVSQGGAAIYGPGLSVGSNSLRMSLSAGDYLDLRFSSQDANAGIVSGELNTFISVSEVL